MKLIVILALTLVFSQSQAQELENTLWIKIFATKSDGNVIIGGDGRDKFVQSYYFKENTVVLTLGNIYLSEQPFSIKNGVLSIGNLLKYRIDTVTDIVLKLTEISQYQEKQSELNTYSFINSKYAFRYFKEKNQVNIIGDTLIDCNTGFSPIYSKEGLMPLLSDAFRKEDSIKLYGYFIINADHEISTVKIIKASKNISEKKVKKFTQSIQHSGKGWLLPETDKAYSFKVKFLCDFKSSFYYFNGRYNRLNGAQIKLID